MIFVGSDIFVGGMVAIFNETLRLSILNFREMDEI